MTTQIEGDLTLFYGKNLAEIYGTVSLKLTPVKEVGDSKFFRAARDYIFENNARMFIHDTGWPKTDNPSTVFRLCVMREEGTSLEPIETYHKSTRHGGIACVAACNGLGRHVIINGNQVDFSAGTSFITAGILSILNWLDPLPSSSASPMTDKCHGRILTRHSSAFSPASNDHYDSTTNAPGTSMRGSVLAGPDPIPSTPPTPGPKHVAQAADIQPIVRPGAWSFSGGRVPSGPWAGIGGLSTNLYDRERANEPTQWIGTAPLDNDGKGCVFTATVIKGEAYIPTFYSAAQSSGVPLLPGSIRPTDLKLFILDSGTSSVALMHRNPDGDWHLDDRGAKHLGIPYYVNTYVAFGCLKPRP